MTVEAIADMVLFHVTRPLPYNPHAPLVVGSQLTIGVALNPFFGFFQQQRTYPVTTNGQTVEVPAISFLVQVRDGKVNAGNLPLAAWQIANHFMLLSRELIYEQVRLKERPSAPSRTTCLWCADTPQRAAAWAARLGGQSQTLRLRATGQVIRVDAGLLMGDSEPYSTTLERASHYWAGAVPANSTEPEILFEGTATVEAIDDGASLGHTAAS